MPTRSSCCRKPPGPIGATWSLPSSAPCSNAPSIPGILVRDFDTTDAAPDSGGLDYAFIAIPPAALGPVAIVVSGDQVVVTAGTAVALDDIAHLQVRDASGERVLLDAALSS